MEYPDDYKLAMTTILQQIEKEHFDDPYISDMEMVDILYQDIVAGLDESQIYVKEEMFETIPLNKLSYPDSSRFKSVEIDKYIRETMISQLSFTFNLLGRKINVIFGIMNDNLITCCELTKNMRLIYSWLYVCHKYSKRICGREINIDIYFTSFNKGFPNSDSTILGPNNVNSAYSTVCEPSNRIVIFRKEEWFKIFIHECAHSFGFEPSDASEAYLSNAVKSLVSITPRVRVSEAYVETWARIINVFYSAIENSSEYEDFLSILNFTMKVESMFSVMQSYRILAFMKTPYNIIIDPTKHNECNLYNEKTSVFAYYVLCGSFMNKPFKFINWSSKHNSQSMQFDNKNVVTFANYITECLHDNSFETLMLKFRGVANRKFGIRFTITELAKN
jgi:hypothetical protein